MIDFKKILLETGMFDDNPYLDKYLKLIYDNFDNQKIKNYTQCHHIIPKAYFKLRNEVCDNSRDNLINLPYKEHVLAHYYLERCIANSALKGKNFFAVYKLCGSANISKTKLYRILEDENLLEEFLQYKAYEGIFSKEHREKLSATDKLMIYVHKDGIQTKIYPDKLSEYLAMGWIRGGKPGRLSSEHKEKLAKSHKGMFDEKFKKEQSIRTSNYYKTHIEARRARSYKVRIYNGKICYEFESCFEAGQFMGIPDIYIKSGKMAEWIKLGYIKRRKCPFDGWKVEKIV